jgi:carbamate kinase
MAEPVPAKSGEFHLSDIPRAANRRLAVYAIGGNALSDPAAVGSEASAAAEQVMEAVLEDVVDLLEAGYRVVLTHGNGPQVGEMLLMEEALFDRRDEGPQPAGLDHWVAATQGTLGHEIATRLDSVLTRRGRHEQVATILTRVQVDPDDPAFAHPTKPIGPLIDDLDSIPKSWEVGVTAAGPRRIVASPLPQSILDADAINALLEAGAVVLCAGGGGIPVVSGKSGIEGVEAVIDKDRVSSLIAQSIGAKLLLVSTAIDAIRLDFGKSTERKLQNLSVADATTHLDDGQFPPGSMGPKVEAMLDAKRHDFEMTVVLCQPGQALPAIRGEAGTTITN